VPRLNGRRVGDEVPELENLRGAAATDRYTPRVGGLETREPEFTSHGFRSPLEDVVCPRIKPMTVNTFLQSFPLATDGLRHDLEAAFTHARATRKDR